MKIDHFVFCFSFAKLLFFLSVGTYSTVSTLQKMKRTHVYIGNVTNINRMKSTNTYHFLYMNKKEKRKGKNLICVVKQIYTIEFPDYM